MGIIRFGSQGWRARIGDGFDQQSVLRIVHAAGSLWSTHYEGSLVLVGYDARRNSARLALAAGKALASHGMQVVVSSGPCPTPALAWQIAHNAGCVGGLMLTAGDAAYQYGGIILLGNDGGPMDRAFVDLVERRVGRYDTTMDGHVLRADFTKAYLNEMAWQVDTSLIASRRLRVVVDPLYATGADYARQLLQRVGCEVIAIHDQCVPDFRGLHPDACEPWVDACERAVVEHKADLGLVFDGDCSHLGVVDETGRLVSLHDVAPLALEHLIEQRGLQGRVVATLASSARLRLQAERLGCPFSMVPVGSESLRREFAEGDVLMAADEHGGLYVPHHLCKPDALYAALMLVELLSGLSESMLEHVTKIEQQMGRMEYGSRNVRLDFSAMQRLRNLLPGTNPVEICGMEAQRVSHADGLRMDFEDGSWLLLRPSRTRQLARCAAEAPTAAQRDQMLAAAAALAHNIA